MAFGLGLSPKAPGTVGSLPGLVVACGLSWLAGEPGGLSGSWLSPATLAVTGALVGATLVAWWVIHRAEQALGIHDDQRIVLDEVVGQAIAVAYTPVDWRWYLAGFILFRLLDITKPGPIGWLDRRGPGAFGTLFDDVLAGMIAALILVLAHRLLA